MNVISCEEPKRIYCDLGEGFAIVRRYKTWFIEKMLKGKRVSRTLKTDDKDEAIKRGLELMRSINKEKSSDPPETVSVGLLSPIVGEGNGFKPDQIVINEDKLSQENNKMVKRKPLKTRVCKKCNRKLTALSFRDSAIWCGRCVRALLNRKNCVWKKAAIVAIKRGICFEITESEYDQLIKECCYSCGDKLPDKGVRLDRIDNNDSYRVNNVKPCCGMCNLARQNIFTPDEMVSELGPAIKRIKAKRLINGSGFPA